MLSTSGASVKPSTRMGNEMPKRVIDFDALWASDKLAACAEWAQAEYAWLYGLADASGSFEFTNLRVIWGRVAAIRKNLTLERLREIFDEFIARGLLFTWEENGKRYGHWTGSDIPGRLPRASWRARLEKLAPPVPREALAAYSARFGGSKEAIVLGAGGATRAGFSEAAANQPDACLDDSSASLTHEREEAHAQDWDLSLNSDENLETDSEKGVVAPTATQSISAGMTPEEMLAIYSEERAELPSAGAMTPERRRRCLRWLASGITAAEFRAAVRAAAATPFLAGTGDRGWRASFDWLIANPGNVGKVLAGEYAPNDRRGRANSRPEKRGLADLYVGIAPRPADCGVRVNPAALERIRARQAAQARASPAASLARK